MSACSAPPAVTTLIKLSQSFLFTRISILQTSLSLSSSPSSLSPSLYQLQNTDRAAVCLSVPDYKQPLFIISSSEPNGKTNHIDYTRFPFTIPEEERGRLAFHMQPLTHISTHNHLFTVILCYSPSLLTPNILPL